MMSVQLSHLLSRLYKSCLSHGVITILSIALYVVLLLINIDPSDWDQFQKYS
jgi:hypothetical protein